MPEFQRKISKEIRPNYKKKSYKSSASRIRQWSMDGANSCSLWIQLKWRMPKRLALCRARGFEKWNRFIGSKRQELRTSASESLDRSKTQPSNGAKWQHPLNAPPAFLRPQLSDSAILLLRPQKQFLKPTLSQMDGQPLRTFSAQHSLTIEQPSKRGIIKTKKMLIIGIQTLWAVRLKRNYRADHLARMI